MRLIMTRCSLLAALTATLASTSLGDVTLYSTPFHRIEQPCAASTFCAQFVRGPPGQPDHECSRRHEQRNRDRILFAAASAAMPELRPGGNQRRPASSIATGPNFVTRRGGCLRAAARSTSVDISASCSVTAR